MNKEQIDKKFDEEFVKDNGENIEPSFLDPEGAVGPIKQFIHQQIEEVIGELVGEKQEEYYDCARPGCENRSDVCKHIGEWQGYNEKRKEMITKAQQMGYRQNQSL